MLLPLAAAALAGCQIGGPPPPEAYERLGNAICAKNTEDLAAIAADLSSPDIGQKERGKLRNKVSALHRNELSSLKQLAPPDSVKDRVDSMYAAYSDILRMLDGKRAQSGETMTLGEATAGLNAKLRSIALTDCARTVSVAFPGEPVGD